jgi:CheY-like chemotaxis protein
VAEDNPVNAMVLQHMLDTMGLSADHVGNGLEAVQAVQQVPYDLVLMDMLMPEMDGLEATRRIRALPLPQQPHIAALTANALSEDRARCLEAGMDGFLSKPLKTEDLHAYLATWARAGRP